MNEKQLLYTIIILLIILNVTIIIAVASTSLRLSSKMGWFNGVMGMGSMMNGSENHWQEHAGEFNTWEEMKEHMQEGHNKMEAENEVR